MTGVAGDVVKHYRTYKLRTVEGGILQAKDVQAADDAEALAKAEADEDCPICEIWQGANLVGMVTEEDRPATPFA